jgi:hypothetical protein
MHQQRSIVKIFEFLVFFRHVLSLFYEMLNCVLRLRRFGGSWWMLPFLRLADRHDLNFVWKKDLAAIDRSEQRIIQLCW